MDRQTDGHMGEQNPYCCLFETPHNNTKLLTYVTGGYFYMMSLELIFITKTVLVLLCVSPPPEYFCLLYQNGEFLCIPGDIY